MGTKPPGDRSTRRLRVWGFFAALLLPAVIWCLDMERALEPLEESDQPFNRAFGFRASLIRLNATLRMGLFGVSPNKDVLPGREGWYFLSRHEGRRLLRESHQTESAFQEFQIRRNELEKAMSFCRGQGVELLVAIAPSKASLYSDYLPLRYRSSQLLSAGETFKGSLSADARQSVLLFSHALEEAKAMGQLYHKTDTHWNPLGAWVASKRLTEVLNRETSLQLPELPVPERIEMRRRSGGDLMRLMGLTEFHEETVPVPLISTPTVRKASGDVLERAPFAALQRGASFQRLVSEKGAGYKVVIIHDSFGIELMPFIGSQVAQSVWVWDTRFRVDVVEAEKPDLVVWLFMDRHLR